MQTISKQDFLGLFQQNRGAECVTIVAMTSVRVTKDCPFGAVFKKSTVNGMVNWRYENSVNRQREREDKEADFQALPRAWGQRLEGLPFVEHKGKHYIELKVQSSLEYKYYDAQGNEINKEALTPFLPKPSNGRQGLEKAVILRDYALESVAQINMRGMEYVVTA